MVLNIGLQHREGNVTGQTSSVMSTSTRGWLNNTTQSNIAQRNKRELLTHRSLYNYDTFCLVD